MDEPTSVDEDVAHDAASLPPDGAGGLRSGHRRRVDHPRPADRRAPERRVYTVDQLLGRAPIRLRRRTDKARLAAHLAAVVLLAALTAWWVIPLHPFAGPVLVTLGPGRGVHLGDLPSLIFLLVAARSLFVTARILRR